MPVRDVPVRDELNILLLVPVRDELVPVRDEDLPELPIVIFVFAAPG